MAKQSRKQAELLRMAEEVVPIVEYDLPQAEEAQPTQNETQPVAADCASEADASNTRYTQDTIEQTACQEKGPENGENGRKMAQDEAPKAPSMTLDQIKAQIEQAAAEQARRAIEDLAAAKKELAADKAQYGQAVAEAEARVAGVETQISEARRAGEARIAEIRAKAEAMADETVSVLGNQAQEQACAILEQIQAAQAAEITEAEAESARTLAGLQAKKQAAEAALTQAKDDLEVVMALNQGRIADLEKGLAELVAASEAAGRVIHEERGVTELVAKAEAFVTADTRDTAKLERLAEQLARYAAAYPAAAYAIAGLQAHARGWYADQLRDEIEALQPGRDFEDRLTAVIARAEEAGVGDLVAEAVREARRHDRQALAEKGRAARLYARELANGQVAGAPVDAGDVVTYRPGRVTVYRSLNGSGKYRISAAWRLNGQGWVEINGNPVGRTVSKINDRRRLTVQ